MSAQSFIYNPSATTSASTGDGFAAPRTTTAGRLAINFGTSDKGMMVFDTDFNNLFIWTGTAWESVPASGDAGANGSVQYNDNGVVSGAANLQYNKASGFTSLRSGSALRAYVADNSVYSTITDNGAAGGLTINNLNADGISLRIASTDVLNVYAGIAQVTGSATITGDLTVDTNTLKVDSTNNRVGIVNATPSFTLDVNGAGSSICARISSGSGTGLRFDTTRNIGGLNRNYLIGPDLLNEGWFAIIPSTALGGGTFTNSIYNASSDGIHTWNNGAGGELMRLNTTGNLVLKGGTAGANGVGVTFPATQVASSDANCLDDYEEGTFVPTISAGAGTPTTTTVNLAKYTKIGRIVEIEIDVSIVAIGTASSYLQFSLPFTPASDSNVGALREVGATALMGQIFAVGGANAGAALYNNGTVWVNGYRIRGTYNYTV